MHGHSFTGNPLGAAVAREVLAVMRDESVIATARERGERMRARMREVAGIPGVLRVRGVGMTAAADLGTGGYAGEAGWRVYREALERGAYLRPLGDTVYVAPPLTIGPDELERLMDVFSESVAAALVR